jgi:hypothetical protein
MTYATMAMQGVGTAMQVFGSLYKGQSDAYSARVESEAKARTAEAQAEADTFNAKVYRQIAESETDRVAAEATDYRRSQSANVAKLRAKQAGSGFALSGSPLMVDEAIFQEIEFSSNRIAYAGQVARTRMVNQASLLDLSATRNKDTAKFARAAGEASADNIITGSYINAITSGAKGFNDMLKGYSSMATRQSAPAAASSGEAFYISRGTSWF